MGLFDIFKKKVVLTEYQLRWNKMWDLWTAGAAASPYSELMTYQSEINNGGHSQYFTNVSGTGDLQQEMSVLAKILPKVLTTNLANAHKAHLALEANENDEQADEVLARCDDVFYENEEKINHILEEYASKLML